MGVSFTSQGYGNGWVEQEWAFPPTYGVRSAGDWKVSAVTAETNTVSIVPGWGFGYGVTDKTIATETFQLDPVAAGTRWDLIACRRSWITGTSEFVRINGGTSPTLPGGRNAGPGNIDDQPLALVPVTPDGIDASGIIDLRCWAGDGGGLIANHDLVRSFRNTIGTRLNINGVDWVRRPGPSGSPEWAKVGEVGTVDVYGTGAALHGIAGPGDFLIQAGTFVGTTDGAGYTRLTFPKPFPNGLLHVSLTNGDGWASGPGVTFAAAGNVPSQGGSAFGQAGYGSKTEVVYEMCAANGTKAVNKPHRINWLAIGW